MKRNFSRVIMALAVLLAVFSSCTRIDAGYTGIKVNMYGDNKGVDNVTEVTGRVHYNPWTTKVYEFPTFVQNSVWTADSQEGSPNNEEFRLTSKDGLEVKCDVSLNYRVMPEHVTTMFKKYRKPLKDISNTVLRNYTREGYNQAASQFTAEQMYAQRSEFEALADSLVRSILIPEGFTVEKVVLINSLRMPSSVVAAIEAKVKAKQLALQKKDELAQATADANKRIEKARGEAESLKMKADAEAYAYQKKTRALTPLLVQQQFIEKWNGDYGTGNMFGQGAVLYKNIGK